jgi:hypothetical protein
MVIIDVKEMLRHSCQIVHETENRTNPFQKVETNTMANCRRKNPKLS